MHTRFLSHNTHLEDPDRFADLDPQLHRLKSQRYRHHSYLLDELLMTYSDWIRGDMLKRGKQKHY